MADYDGTPENNFHIGTEADDAINGAGGDDQLFGMDGKDLISGDEGNDRLVGGNGFDELNGGDGDDILNGGGGDLTIFSYTGKVEQPTEEIFGGAGTDTLRMTYAGFIHKPNPKEPDFQPISIVVDITKGSGAVQVFLTFDADTPVTGELFDGIEKLDFVGPDGNDVAIGGAFSDSLMGNGGNDFLVGNGGDDFIQDLGGMVNADGGEGEDHIWFVLTGITSNVLIDAEQGTVMAGKAVAGKFLNFESAKIGGGEGNDKIFGYEQKVNELFGQEGNDLLRGGAFADQLYGDEGNDRIFGEAGDDYLYGDIGDDFLDAGDGGDDLVVGEGRDEAYAGGGDDFLQVTRGALAAGSILDGGSGFDILDLDLRTSTIDLTGVTFLRIEKVTSSFAGTIKMSTTAFEGFADITANNNNVTVALTDNADVSLKIGKFSVLQLAEGGQRLNASNYSFGIADIAGGSGDDTLIGSKLGRRVDANLGGGNDLYNGKTASDSVHGEGGNDRLNGGAAANYLTGGDGKDRLNGGEGNDSLDGGAGTDVLIGGLGADTLTGGAKNDVFGYLALADSGLDAISRDKIADLALEDRIDVSAIDAKAGTPADDAFAYIGEAAFSKEGQIRAYQDGANVIVEFNTAGATGAEMTLQLSNLALANLSAGQFLL